MLTVAWLSPFPPDRNGGGGHMREAYLLAGLATQASIHLICPGPVLDGTVRAAVAALVEVPLPPVWRDQHKWLRRAADLAAAAGSRHPIEVRAFRPLRRAMRPAVAALSADVVLVSYSGLASLVPSRRGVPWVLSFVNLPSRMAAQQAAVMPHRRQRWLLEHDARAARAFERRVAGEYDAVIVPTAADAAALTEQGGASLPPVLVVPNGTDVERLQPSPIPPDPRLVFTGALYTTPNVDAAVWLCRVILPLVQRATPAAQLDIVGARPSPEVRELGQLPGVTVHADVADVAPFLRAARVAMVPIRVGSGSRIKALEAMAAGRPVVGTTIGLEGLDLAGGVEALIADDAAAFAAATVRLLADDLLAASLATAARAAVEERFAWPAISASFTDLVLGVRRSAVTTGERTD